MVSAITIDQSITTEFYNNQTSNSIHDAAVNEIAIKALSYIGTNSQTKSLFSSTEKKNAFNSVTRYLSNYKKWLDIAAERSKEVEELCDNLVLGQWETILNAYKSDSENLAIDGLKAFHGGKITVEQFTTITFAYSIIKEHPEIKIHVCPLFDHNGLPNAQAKNIISETLKPTGILKGKEPFLTRDQIVDFFKKMRSESLSEQNFFFIESKETLNKTRTITEGITDGTGVNVFNYFNLNDNTYRMVPSFSMMQQFLNAVGKKNAVTITPVIGLSSIEDILYNGKNSTRDLALPFPGITLPKEADKHSAPASIDFINHDFYHAIVTSYIPPICREAFIAYAETILKIKTELEKDLKESTDEERFVCSALKELYERIVDMEHTLFRSHKRNSIFETFTSEQLLQIDIESFLLILSISDQQQYVVDRLMATDLQYQQYTSFSEDVKTAKALNIIKKLVSSFKTHYVLEKIADLLIKDNFCEKYHVNINCLQLIVKKLIEYRDLLKTMLPNEQKELAEAVIEMNIATHLLRRIQSK